MCGIFGLVVLKNTVFSTHMLMRIIDRLFIFSESRGKEASGLALHAGNEISYYKDAVSAHDLIRSRTYKNFLKFFLLKSFSNNRKTPVSSLAVVGHTRLATNGTQYNMRNNQPIVNSSLAGIHNGIVVNADTLYDMFSLTKKNESNDSVAIFDVLEHLIENEPSVEAACRKVYANLEGSASLACLIPKRKSLLLATNTGSLYYCINKSSNFYVFASEKHTVSEICKKLNSKTVGKETVKQIKAGEGACIYIDSLNIDFFPIESNFSSHRVLNLNQRVYYDRLIRNNAYYDSGQGLPPVKRCAKCILPETIPYIKFNSNGVCNYCLKHKQIQYKGYDALENVASKYRRTDGRPDCLVAISGGRDSAYALHYVKKVLKMNPIAFTYDWGMVADIARRNQARLVGKLGIEHIVISADIKKQRKFIGQNVKAWLKNPHLGMVVLFMAGDKPAEYYIKKTAQKYDINLVILARGNEFENTDFKWGFLGMPCGEPAGVLHDLSFAGRMIFSINSVMQLIRNPAYFNSAIWETMFDYWATYMLRYNFLYLWHYISWNESEIVSTLKSEYNWETFKDTIQTWRIDDGTMPFYNYIYYTIAGFTENDAFRSNQIRDGIITREEGLRLVAAENMPRHKAIREYLDKIGLDYKKVIERIEEVPKLYAH